MKRVLCLAAMVAWGCGDDSGGGFRAGFSTGAIRSIHDFYRWDKKMTMKERYLRTAHDAIAAGGSWLRPHISWKNVEPIVEKTDLRVEKVTSQMVEYYAFQDVTKVWSTADLLVNTLTQNGLQLVVVINGAYTTYLPDFRTSDGKRKQLLPDEVGQESYLGLIYLHARAVVRRYRDRVKHWQLENEPNVAGETVVWGWRDGSLWKDMKFVGRVLDTLHRAVKQEDPNAQTTTNFHTDLHYKEDILAWHQYLDYIGIDAFPNYLWGYNPTGKILGERVASIIAMGLNKPVVILESGYPTEPKFSGFSEARQVQYIHDAVSSACEAGAAGFFYFTLSAPRRAARAYKLLSPTGGSSDPTTPTSLATTPSARRPWPAPRSIPLPHKNSPRFYCWMGTDSTVNECAGKEQ